MSSPRVQGRTVSRFFSLVLPLVLVGCSVGEAGNPPPAPPAPEVTTAEVAKRAEMAIGTVYRFFPDRIALMLGVYQYMQDQYVALCIDTREFRFERLSGVGMEIGIHHHSLTPQA